jgi:hypothetical protein
VITFTNCSADFVFFTPLAASFVSSATGAPLFGGSLGGLDAFLGGEGALDLAAGDLTVLLTFLVGTDGLDTGYFALDFDLGSSFLVESSFALPLGWF